MRRVHGVRYRKHTGCEGNHGILLRYMIYGVRAKRIASMDPGSLILDSDEDEDAPSNIMTADDACSCTVVLQIEGEKRRDGATDRTEQRRAGQGRARGGRGG
jgi:hypothetical protein